MALKAFAPQLQTTFVKALSDPSKQTRSKAILALGKLMAIATRVDPLLTELAGQCTGAESNAIRCSTIDALATVLEKGGHLATPPVLEKVKTVVFTYALEEDELLRQGSCAVIGKLAAYGDGVFVGDIVLDLADVKVLKAQESLYSVCGRVLSIGNVMQHAGRKMEAVREDAFKFLKEALREESKPTIIAACCSALLAAFSMPTHSSAQDREQEFRECVIIGLDDFCAALCQNSTRDKSEECRRLSMGALKMAAKLAPGACRKHAAVILPVLFEAWRDINLRIKGIADRLFYSMSAGGEATHISSFCTVCSGEDSAFLRNYAKVTIARMKPTEDEEECW